MLPLAHMIPKIFRKAWLRYGRPMMWAVRPVADWSLPAGFAYDSETDMIQNGAGLVLTNVEDYWAGGYIYIVPMGRSGDLDVLVAAGIVPEGTVDVYILRDDAPTVKVAHSIEIDGDWYDVLEVAHAPVGIGDSALWARVRLRRRS